MSGLHTRAGCTQHIEALDALGRGGNGFRRAEFHPARNTEPGGVPLNQVSALISRTSKQDVSSG
ncbi:MAG: hypothetical protein ACRDSP_08110 [Pseudonocardiaceae bacterium]